MKSYFDSATGIEKAEPEEKEDSIHSINTMIIYLDTIVKNTEAILEMQAKNKDLHIMTDRQLEEVKTALDKLIDMRIDYLKRD